MTLTQNELQRYSRHLILPEVGVEGQEKLKAAKILLIGAGGLGSPVSLYLAAAGVGTLGIIDDDIVDVSNLQRQIIHGAEDVGRPKVESAIDSLKRINPEVKVVPYKTRLSKDNILDILKNYDFIVDGTDNFQTRYLVNDACVMTKKPFVYGSIYRFEGQVSVFWPGKGPTYRCLFSEPPPPDMAPSCSEGGVLGVLPGIIGTLQAMEAIKIVLGKGDLLLGRMLLFDAMRMQFRQVKFRANPDSMNITAFTDYDAFCNVGRGNESVGSSNKGIPEITVAELKKLMDKKADVELVDVREEYEYQMCQIPDSKLIPLGTLPQRYIELNSAKETIVHCHHGGRSAKAIEFLKTKGFTNLKNLVGGIDAWSVEIDDSVARY